MVACGGRCGRAGAVVHCHVAFLLRGSVDCPDGTGSAAPRARSALPARLQRRDIDQASSSSGVVASGLSFQHRIPDSGSNPPPTTFEMLATCPADNWEVLFMGYEQANADVK